MLIPDSWLPKIGKIALTCTELDSEINSSIAFLLRCDLKVATAITEKTFSAHTRLEMLRDIGSLRLEDDKSKEKFQEIISAIGESLEQRNRLFHDNPTWLTPSTGEIGFFRSNVHMRPKPPTVINDQWLHELQVCMGFQILLLKRFNGTVTIEGEDWRDAQVPWPNKSAQQSSAKNILPEGKKKKRPPRP